jgi:transcriptional regulator with XRE-family HTH domain
MDMIGKIRRLSRRGKKSEREISRMTGLSRITVSKWPHSEVEKEPKYRRKMQPGKLTAFLDSQCAFKFDHPCAVKIDQG